MYFPISFRFEWLCACACACTHFLFFVWMNAKEKYKKETTTSSDNRSTSYTFCCAINTEAAERKQVASLGVGMCMRAAKYKKETKKAGVKIKSQSAAVWIFRQYVWKVKALWTVLQLNTIQFCHKNIALNAISPLDANCWSMLPHGSSYHW